MIKQKTILNQIIVWENQMFGKTKFFQYVQIVKQLEYAGLMTSMDVIGHCVVEE